MPARRKCKNKKKKKTGLNANDLISEVEAAAYLGISPQWLRMSRMNKPAWDGPRYVRVSTRCIRYRVRHLDEFIAARVVDPADRFAAA